MSTRTFDPQDPEVLLRRSASSAAGLDLGPLFARPTDPDTSHDAARGARSAAQVQRLRRCEALLEGPANADQLDERIGWRPTTAGRRLSELERHGYVESTGHRAPTRSGKVGYAYRLTATGRAALEAAGRTGGRHG